MANMQKYFNKFHEKIKLEYDDNKVLREKRDEILEELKVKLMEDSRSVRVFHQGSYSMHTGIKALDKGDYDIDVGLIFEVDIDEYSNPIDVKKWVYDNLKDKYTDITMKKPCVTIEFESEQEDERNYHVDFAIYAENPDSDTRYLAKGRLHSSKENRSWEESEPEELVKKIKENYEDKDDRSQFRRVIRYLKRWKDLQFKDQINRPSGIGITLGALEYFQPYIGRDLFSGDIIVNDLDATEHFVSRLIDNFEWTFHDDELAERLKIVVPTKPNTDVYDGMTNLQMEEFKSKLETLLENLKEAMAEVDPISACETLSESFGDDFKIEDETEVAKKKKRTMIPSHSSAWSINDEY